jgi:hypothetical protein
MLYSGVGRQNSSQSVWWPPTARQPAAEVETQGGKDDGADEESNGQTESAQPTGRIAQGREDGGGCAV